MIKNKNKANFIRSTKNMQFFNIESKHVNSHVVTLTNQNILIILIILIKQIINQSFEILKYSMISVYTVSVSYSYRYFHETLKRLITDSFIHQRCTDLLQQNSTRSLSCFDSYSFETGKPAQLLHFQSIRIEMQHTYHVCTVCTKMLILRMIIT